MDNGSGIRRHHYVYFTYQRSSNVSFKLEPHLRAPPPLVLGTIF
jgi:hypothetical protein